MGWIKLSKYEFSYYENPANRININRLDSNTVVAYYQKNISNKIFRFDTQNGDIIYVPFKDSNFCHLVGLHKLGYDGLEGFNRLQYTNIDFGKINRANLGKYQEFINYKDRTKNFNKLYNILTKSQLSIVYDYKKPSRSNMNKIKHILVWNDNKRKASYNIGLGLKENGLYYPNSYMVNYGKQFDKFTRDQTVEKIIFTKEYDKDTFNKIYKDKYKNYIEKLYRVSGGSIQYNFIKDFVIKSNNNISMIDKEVNAASISINKYNNLINQYIYANQKNDKETIAKCNLSMRKLNCNNVNQLLDKVKGIKHKITELDSIKSKIITELDFFINAKQSYDNIKFLSIKDMYNQEIKSQIAITKGVARDLEKLNLKHNKVCSIEEISNMKDDKIARSIIKKIKAREINKEISK
jgi:hypothetical protein